MKVDDVRVMKVTTRIKSVERSEFVSKKGADTAIMIVRTEAGSFSNYASVWERQGIDLDKVSEGDAVEIQYKVYRCEGKNREFKNFITIKLLDGTDL